MPFFKDFTKVVKPKQSYSFDVVIYNTNYSTELQQVRIVASIYLPYLIYVLEFLVDSNDLIQEKIYGQNFIKFKLNSAGDDGFLFDSDYVELMVIHSSFLLTQKDALSREKQIDKTPFQVICVERKNFSIATQMINDVFHGKKIKEILEDIVKNKLKSKLEIDEEGLNNKIIDQIIIPPISFCSAIRKYLDKPFGIYDGPYQIKINHSDIKNGESSIIIRNLSKQMNSSHIIVHQLATNNPDNIKVIEKCGDGTNFYTYSIHKSNFNANPVFAAMATVAKHIIKPKDSLYGIIQQKLDEVCKRSGLMSKKDANIPYDEILKSRIKYYTDNTGLDKEDKTFANAMMSKRISSLANITVNVERSFKLNNLLEVGKPVKFKPYVTEYANLAGNYILSGTDLKFTKDKALQWNSTATIRMIRSHKEIV